MDNILFFDCSDRLNGRSDNVLSSSLSTSIFPLPSASPLYSQQKRILDVWDQGRQEKALKNRKSAQASRERKKVQLERLESENEQFKFANCQLNDRIRSLEQENSALKDKLDHIKLEMQQLRDVMSMMIEPSFDKKKESIKESRPSVLPDDFTMTDLPLIATETNGNDPLLDSSCKLVVPPPPLILSCQASFYPHSHHQKSINNRHHQHHSLSRP